MKEKSSYFQEWLISIALMITIPTTFYLGVTLVAPKVDFDRYHKEYMAFFKGYSYQNAENHKQREREWAQSKVAIDYEVNKCKKTGLMLIASGIVLIPLLFLGSIFVLPVIGFGLLLAGLEVFAINFFTYAPCNKLFYGLDLLFIEMLFSLIGLLIVLLFAYKSSEKNK